MQPTIELGEIDLCDEQHEVKYIVLCNLQLSTYLLLWETAIGTPTPD
jgi:hypothetical protein